MGYYESLIVGYRDVFSSGLPYPSKGFLGESTMRFLPHASIVKHKPRIFKGNKIPENNLLKYPPTSVNLVGALDSGAGRVT